MSLLQSSNDSFQNILSYLRANEIFRLMVTGSKALISRLQHNSTDIVWRAEKPFLFPLSLYDYPNLRSLSIKGSSGDAPRYISTKGRSPLPLEPVDSLATLALDFSNSPSILAPNSAGMRLNWAFPNLTSLSVRSIARDITFIDSEWQNHLPKTLISLTVEFSKRYPLLYSNFAYLPKGLQILRILTPNGVNSIALAYLKNLVTFEMLHTRGFVASISLPASLEEFIWHSADILTYQRHPQVPKFPISKMPPKIRVWSVQTHFFEFEFDSIAPPTLEELNVTWGPQYTLQDLQKHFHCERLKIIPELRAHPMPISWLATLTHLESWGHEKYVVAEDDGVTECTDYVHLLPKTLKILSLPHQAEESAPWSSVKLPPSLTELTTGIRSANDVLQLPKTLTKLKITTKETENVSEPIPAEVWRALPPYLKHLEINTSLFDSENCLLALPETLESLTLNCGSALFLERLSFPAHRSSLETLHVRLLPLKQYFRLKADFFTRLDGLVALKTLIFEIVESGGQCVLRSDTLAHLPASLTSLSLKGIAFDNFGLPQGTVREGAKNWKEEGALSRLPRGLISLTLLNMGYITPPLFSNLPEGLDLLHTDSIIYQPRETVAALPKRISLLKFDAYYAPYKPSPGETDERMETTMNTIKSAREDFERLARPNYYSDSFWRSFGVKLDT